MVKSLLTYMRFLSFLEFVVFELITTGSELWSKNANLDSLRHIKG